MLLDKRDGTIYLPTGVVIRSNLRKNDFLYSEIGKISSCISYGPEQRVWSIPAGQWEDRIIGCSLHFNGQLLGEVGVKFDEPGDPRANWNTETQMRIKAYHDGLLEQDLGKPPYIFTWGVAHSGYSDKDVDSSIFVRYVGGYSARDLEDTRQVLIRMFGPPGRDAAGIRFADAETMKRQHEADQKLLRERLKTVEGFELNEK